MLEGDSVIHIYRYVEKRYDFKMGKIGYVEL